MSEELIKRNVPSESEGIGVPPVEGEKISVDSPKVLPQESVYKTSTETTDEIVDVSVPLRTEIAEIMPDRQEHILAEKHDWHKVVSLPISWDKVAQVMSKVLNDGTEGKYKSVFSKTLNVISNIVEVTYAKIKDGIIKVSDAWVRK